MYKITVRQIIHTRDLVIRAFGKGGPTNDPATTFRFRFAADICCWIFNKGDDGWSTYTVVKIK